MIDLETILITDLVDDNVLAGHVSSKLPKDFEEHLPYGTLRRAPGSRYIDENTKKLEAVRLQTNVYGPMDDPAAAFEGMKTLIDAIVALEGTTVASVVITAVDVPQTPDWAPDPDSSRPGYRTFVTVYAHP